MDVVRLQAMHASDPVLGHIAFNRILELVQKLLDVTAVERKEPEVLKEELVQCHLVLDQGEVAQQRPMDHLFALCQAATGHTLLHPLVHGREATMAQIIASESTALVKKEVLECFQRDDVDSLAFLCNSRLLEVADLWDELFTHMLGCQYSKHVMKSFARLMCKAGMGRVPMCNDTRAPLAYACSQSSPEESLQHVVTEIISQPFLPVDMMDEFQRTALHHACLAKKPDSIVIRLLLQHGASARAQDGGGFTPLHFLASRAEYDCCKLVLDVCKAPVLLRSKSGKLPLDCLLERIVHGSMNTLSSLAVETLQLLLECGGRKLRRSFLEESNISFATLAESCTPNLRRTVCVLLCAYGYRDSDCRGFESALEINEGHHLPWTTAIHKLFPTRFREAICTLLLLQYSLPNSSNAFSCLDGATILVIIQKLSMCDWLLEEGEDER